MVSVLRLFCVVKKDQVAQKLPKTGDRERHFTSGQKRKPFETVDLEGFFIMARGGFEPSTPRV